MIFNDHFDPQGKSLPMFDDVSGLQRPADRTRRAHVERFDSRKNSDDASDSKGPPPDQADKQQAACPPFFRITQPTYRDIMQELCQRSPEAGGALFGPVDSDLVTHFHFDEGAKVSPVTFTLDHVGLNKVLKKHLESGIDCKGIVHSHPPFASRPSMGDLEYVRKCFANERNKGLDVFALPIVCNGNFLPYLISKDDLTTPQLAHLVLV